jgi:hypothetical protein
MPKARKQEELRWLQIAQLKCAAFPRSLPEVNEGPDFLFRESQLGIEVTEYILGQSPEGSLIRRREKIRESLVRTAQSRFETTCKERLQVSIFWSSEALPSKAESKQFVERTVQIVTGLLQQGSECWRPNFSQIDDIKFGKHIGQICIYRLHRSESFWDSVEAGAIGNDVNRVQILICQKDAKVTEYRSKCLSIWLLIVADDKHLSSVFSPDEDFPNATFRTLFDRVFILDSFANEVIELNVSI